MKKLFSFFLLFFLPLAATDSLSDPSQENKPLTVRVLLTKLEKSALIEVRGPYHIYNPHSGKRIASSGRAKRSRITPSDQGISWGKLLPGVFEMRLVPAKEGAALYVDGNEYRGCLEVFIIGGTLNIVNEVDVENYLKSTLAGCLSPHLQTATLDAIVIAERTNLYYNLFKDSYASWQVEAKKTGYRGNKIVAANPTVTSAVERTRHMVMSYKKQPFPTRWSPNLAGRSASYSSVFRASKRKCPKGIAELPSAASRSSSKWTKTLSCKTFAKLVGLKNITEVSLFRAENKVYAVRFIDGSEKKDIAFLALQNLLGKDYLGSNDFGAQLKGKKILFTGYGSGEGVGLCATSAELLARRGDGVEKILSIHFPNTQLMHYERETGKPKNTSYIWK